MGRRSQSIGGISTETAATRYNGVGLVGAGFPSVVAKVNLTAQAAAINATTIYAVPTGGAGLYRVSWSASVTTAAQISCVLGGATGFQIVYTNVNDSVAKTSNPTTLTVSAVNATGTTISNIWLGYCKAGTNLQYALGYTSSGSPAMAFDVNVYVEFLG